MKSRKLLIILFSVLFLQSCGLKFWYNRLDFVVSWSVDDFVELTDEQEDLLELKVREKLQWHRQTELPRYVYLIDELMNDIGTSNIESKYDYYQSQLVDFFQTASREVAPELIDIVSLLSDEQSQQLMQTLNENADETLKKYSKTSKEKRLKRVRSNLTDQVKDWIGKLTKSQKTLIKEWVTEMKSTAKLRFEYSHQWRLAMQTALKDRASRSGQDNIKALILEPASLQTEELKALNAHNETLEKRIILAMHQSLTAKQKKRFMSKLKDYKEDFQDLITD